MTHADGVTVHLTEREWGQVVNGLYTRKSRLEGRAPPGWIDEYDALINKFMDACDDALTCDDTQAGE